MIARELQWQTGDQQVSVRIEESKGHGTFHISNEHLPFRILDSSHIEISGRRYRFYVHRNRDAYTVWLNGRTYRLLRAGKSGSQQTLANASTGEIRAPMPGKILRVEVTVGDSVAEKQTVVVMESMKMETSLPAPQAGRVKDIRCAAGQTAEMGQLLMILE